jgi:hypothetical protein
VRWDGDVPTIDKVPLRHFHFAGSFDPDQPDVLTQIAKHASWWPLLADRPGVARLVREYAERLISRGYREAHAAPPLYVEMSDGRPIEPWMRAGYRAALVEAEQAGANEPPNPFSDDPDHFVEWLESRTVHQFAQSLPVMQGTLGAKEMTTALLDSGKLLGRVRELETIRDEAVSWAERASSELRDAQYAVLAAAEDRRELERMRATMESVWGSASWRVTRPMRAAKAFFRRKRAPAMLA